MTDGRSADLEDEHAGILISPHPHSSTVIVAFGGIKGAAMGMPPFEFFNVLNGLEATTRIFVRDFRQAWYNLGVQGVSDDVPETVEHLRTILSEHDAGRVIFTGCSAGGYAALLFGSLLGVDEIHAFSPQTFLSRRLRLWYRDPRWRRPLHEMRRDAGSRALYLDLREMLAATARGHEHPIVHVYYGSKDRHDAIHARRLRKVPNTTLHEFPRGHRLVRHLRDSGELREILSKAISRGSV